jgi:hypothetical protein
MAACHQQGASQGQAHLQRGTQGAKWSFGPVAHPKGGDMPPVTPLGVGVEARHRKMFHRLVMPLQNPNAQRTSKRTTMRHSGGVRV